MDAMTILVADDDEFHQDMVEENFRDVGITNPIRRFFDGDELIAFLNSTEARGNEQRYLILLDIRMPRMSGTEALAILKGDGRLKSIPVVMLTTTDDPVEINKCYDLGCNCYLVKPVMFEQFSQLLTKLGIFLSLVRLPGLSPSK